MWHVLGYRECSNPGRPPYYSTAFFNIIKDVRENTPLNVASVSVKQWYQLLLERGVTHNSDNPDQPPQLIPTKLELKYPETDFSSAYRLSRTIGLSPDQKSFLFKIMQSLLPTRERLARLGRIQSSDCLYCEGVMDSTAHLLACTLSREVTERLQNCISSYLPHSTPNDIVRLNLPVSDSLELPLTWLVSTCLSHVWDQRSAGKISRLDICRAELFSKLMLLRDTKWRHYSLHNSAVLLEDMVNLHFL